jgi:hypothetical protein
MLSSIIFNAIQSQQPSHERPYDENIEIRLHTLWVAGAAKLRAAAGNMRNQANLV